MAAVDKALAPAALALDMAVCFTQPGVPGTDEVLAKFRIGSASGRRAGPPMSRPDLYSAVPAAAIAQCLGSQLNAGMVHTSPRWQAAGLPPS